MNILRIEDYGYNDFFKRQKEDSDRSGELVVARVTQVHRESYTVVSDMGEKKCKAQGLDLLQPRQRADLSGHGRFCADKAQSYGRRHNIQGIR